MDQQAPGQLEVLRTFLNTWEIPNDTRTPVDHLVTEKSVEYFIKENFTSGVKMNSLEDIHNFRDDLRNSIEKGEIEGVNKWLKRYPFHVRFSAFTDKPEVNFETPDVSFISKLIEFVIEAVSAEQWHRMKACPDCKWVFYDQSRNASKRWCGMYANGPTGRACGTIAKVKRYRSNHQNE